MARYRRIWPTKGQGAQSPYIAGPLAQPLVHATRYAFLTGVVTIFLSFFLFVWGGVGQVGRIDIRGETTDVPYRGWSAR